MSTVRSKNHRIFKSFAMAVTALAFLLALGSTASANPYGTAPVEVDAGNRHACAYYVGDGNVSCFGVDSPYAVYLDSDLDYLEGDAIGFDAGDYTNCVLLPTGNTECWGYRATDLSYSGGDAEGVAVGYGFACVLTSGNVKCSNNPNPYITTPAWSEYHTAGDAEWITASSYALCVKSSSPTLSCQGWNVTEPSWATEGTPLPASGGHYAACMLMAEGNVDCMNSGYNNVGQTMGYSGTDAIDAAGGFDRSCAALSNGDIDCWGRNWPVSGAGFTTWSYNGLDARSVAVSAQDVCYATSTGTVDCVRSTPPTPEPVVVDTDGDGVPDDEDLFPNDASEWADADGDGVGDNSDAFPNDASESADADGDGAGDNADCDDANAAVHPDAAEVVDGLDNDCDGRMLKGDVLIASGVGGKGLTKAPGLAEEFNDTSKAKDRAGKKK